MKQRFLELLPWFMNGTLSESDRAWMVDHLRQNPEAQRDLEWHFALRDDVREGMPPVPDSVGLAGTLARLEREQLPWPRRLARWLRLGSGRVVPVWGYAGLALLVAQGVIIAMLLGERPEHESSGIRAGQSGAPTQGPLLSVVFSSSVTERELRLLLADVQGTLVGGPGQLGRYYVRVPEGTVEAAAETLRKRPGIDAVTVVAGLPLRP